MDTTLDVSRLPQSRAMGGGSDIDIADIVGAFRTVIDCMEEHGLVKPNMSFGFAAAHPSSDNDFEQPKIYEWDDPYSFTWVVTGWGPDRDRYIANAVRKLRASLRTGKDTLQIRDMQGDEGFSEIVESVDEDGNFPWGDFPWGGATFVRSGRFIIPSSVSALRQVEDDSIAKLLGGAIGAKMLQTVSPEEFS